MHLHIITLVKRADCTGITAVLVLVQQAGGSTMEASGPQWPGCSQDIIAQLTCTASSRVGVNTRTYMAGTRRERYSRRSSSGSAKAAVLPDPVAPHEHAWKSDQADAAPAVLKHCQMPAVKVAVAVLSSTCLRTTTDVPA